MSSLKIAFIGHKRIPSREGGIEIVVDELATRMVDRGHQVIAYNRSGHNVAGSEFDGVANGHGKRFSYHGVNVVSVPTIEGKGLAALSSSFFATLQAIKARPDVIHYHAEGPCVMLRLAHWAGIRTVATIHGLDWQRAKWGKFASIYLKFGERTAAECADEIIVLSESMRQYFQEKYGRSTHFIPNGIEYGEPVSAQEITEKYGLHKNDYVLFLGRIVPEKGVHYLIEAFSKLNTNKKLVIAGGASDSNEYYQHIQQMANQDSRVILTGFIQGQALKELYSNAYIYVLPSDLEGMPMSLLEAMSYRLPVIVSDIPANKEMGLDASCYFETGNIEQLADRLQEIIDGDFKQVHYDMEKYGWDGIALRVADVYENLKK